MCPVGMTTHQLFFYTLVLSVAVVRSAIPTHQLSTAEVFARLSKLDEALDTGKQLASELLGYVKMEETRLSKLRRIVGSLENATSRETASNPVSAFLTMLQLSSIWTSELSPIFEYDFSNKHKSLARRFTDKLPGTEDLHFAHTAVLRFQEIYSVPADAIAEGRLLPDYDSPKLTDMQCMRLGLFAYRVNDFNRAIEWYNVVANRLENGTSVFSRGDETSEMVSTTAVYDHLAYALGRAGRYKEALEYTLNLLDEANVDLDPENASFEDLCRSESPIGPPDAALSCYHRVPHPTFLLGPIREELVQIDPPVVLWHEFVTQNEAENIIETSSPRLQRALVRNPANGNLEKTDLRITKNTWLEDDSSELTKRINKRIELFTGLSVEYGEDLQVASYGLGGYYAPHYDYGRHFELDDLDFSNGNRIATFMVYLTPVAAGGATVFTKTGAVVRPVARSAIFWYNLLRSGDGDVRSRHGACPVLAGSKWVMNKWLRSNGQVFKRPCALEREPFNAVDELDPEFD